MGETNPRKTTVPEPSTWPWPAALISGVAVIAEISVVGLHVLQGNSRSQQMSVVCRAWLSHPLSPEEVPVARRTFIPSIQSLSSSSLRASAPSQHKLVGTVSDLLACATKQWDSELLLVLGRHPGLESGRLGCSPSCR